MRTLRILTGLLLTFGSVQAQTEPGAGLWSADLQVDATQLSGDYLYGYTRRNPVVRLELSHGVFLRNGWLAGGSINGYYYRQEQSGTTLVKQSLWQGGLAGFVRKYWGKDQWRIFAGGGLRVSAEQSRQDAGNIQEKLTTYQAYPFTELGALYFLNSRWGLELSTTTSAFPFSFSRFSAGLVYLTGFKSSRAAIGAGQSPAEMSQTRAGRVLVGASVGFINQKSEGSNPTTNTQSISASPSFSIFVANNVRVGVAVPISWQRGSNTQGKTSQTTLGVTPFVRAYLTNARLRPFIGLDASYTTYSFQQEPYEREKISSTVGGSLNAGLAYLLGNHFIAEATLVNLTVGKQTQNNQQKNGLWSETFQITTSPGFAVQYVF